MHTYRLLLADESREGNIPLSALFAGALKERGYELRLFQIGFDEVRTKYLEIATGEPVTVLDPHLLHNDYNVKFMFQCSRKSQALHLFVGPLSLPQRYEEKMELHPVTARVGECLALPVLPLLYADRNAILTAQLTEQLFSQIRNYSGLLPSTVCFAAVLNPKEYQLLEIEMGRRLPYFSLGYIPKNILRTEVSPELLFSEGPHSLKFTSLHSSVRQLATLEDMISWPVVGAMAKRASSWTEIPEELEESPEAFRMGILQHPSLGGAGDGNQRFLEHMGGSTVPLDLYRSQEMDRCDFLYIPHGRAGSFGDPEELERLKKLLGSVVYRKIPFLVEGESVALLGEFVHDSGGKRIPGIAMFPFSASLQGTYPQAHEVFLQASGNTPLLRKGEILHGYRTNGCTLSYPSTRQGEWALRRTEAGGEVGTDGWFMGKGAVVRSCFSLWEISSGVRKWLSSR